MLESLRGWLRRRRHRRSARAFYRHHAVSGPAQQDSASHPLDPTVFYHLTLEDERRRSASPDPGPHPGSYAEPEPVESNHCAGTESAPEASSWSCDSGSDSGSSDAGGGGGGGSD